MKCALTLLGVLAAGAILASPEPDLLLKATWHSPTSSVTEKAAALGSFMTTNETTYAQLRKAVGRARVYSRAYGLKDRFSPPDGFTLLYEADYRFPDGTIWVRFIVDPKDPKDEWKFHHFQVSTHRNPREILSTNDDGQPTSP